ncbi:titin homolog [Anabas testudineus]|uniref:non-specific serine/threonine protein kinase n=1 Tax=Anabas testudineus TaxID=64144 RepID=A0A3Q1J0Y3_ANATE|nr:titin homolog [Anabas testudineus]
MTSRRPMTRSFSGNGRTSSFSEEEGSSSNGRSESRNPYLSNVRPENRSTLCSVMAQLTEDIQPSFETTLKSKAVSENCNVKFTCVVSGYPAPELKWYKDDMEMDRYCGLPKYEIRRNGKTHTLIIYNCTLDDAAIYQASASNSKGIVSCSGVLEVGIMNEYKIHQRFFAKLKQKAEKKKKELEGHTKKEDKENLQQKKPQSSPERPPRKRPVSLQQEKLAVKQPEAVEQLGATAELNGISTDVKESGLEKETPPSEEALAKKKIKISNGVDAGVNNSSSSISYGRSHMMGNGGENCYDGGISLAQFLAETLQSKAGEEKQNSSWVEKPKDVDIRIINASTETEREQETIQKEKEEEENTLDADRETREVDMAIVREEKESQSEMLHTAAHSKHGSEVKHHSKAHKDHDHHNIQASISSMLHTVKDFFFGKSKKDFYDPTDNKERELDHVSTQPSQPETPPSFRLQPQHNPDVDKPLTEDMVPMEMDKPKESSGSVDVEQQSVSLEMHEHSVLHKALAPAHTLPSESVEESTEQFVNEPGHIVEAMEVSVGTEHSSPGEEMPLSGQVLEMEDKDSLVVSLIKEVPVNRQEPACFVLSPHPNHQTARDESSPREDIAVFPPTKATYEEECPPTSNLVCLEESLTTPHNIISDSKSKVPTETLHEEQMSVDKVGKEEKPDTEENCYTYAYNKVYEEEKAEVKSSKQPCSDINRSEITDLTTFSLEEIIEPCESNTQDQVLSPLTAVAAYSADSENVKEETKCTSLIQEMNVGFPPTAAPESLEKGDLKIQPECTTSIVGESTDTHDVSAIQSSGFSNSGERSDLKEVLNFTLQNDLEFNLCNNRKKEKHTIVEGKSTGVMDERLHFEVETDKKVDLDETKLLSVAQNKGSTAKVSEEHSNTVCQDGSKKELDWPSDNIPQIKISTTEETPDITATLPHENQNETHFIIPKIEINEFKECTLPLTILALNKPESEPVISQKYDVTNMPEVIMKDQSTANSMGLLPTQKGMQNDYNLLLSEKVKEVAQLDEETKTFEQEQQHVKSSEQLPQMDCSTVPAINVSYIADKEDHALISYPHDSHTLQPFETPAVPLIVVAPIAVTCHESDPALILPTHSVWTETSAVTQRGTKNDGGNDMPTKPENSQSTKQNLQEIEADMRINKTTPPLLYEAPKVKDNVPLRSKSTEENVTEILALKPLKEIKMDNVLSLEDLQKDKTCVERLTSKPPTHPSLSPASLRKFMSKGARDSDEAVKAVPIITVADPQSDKADEDLSGASTPTSSLSCESSPRLKRRDSLSLIRSATPEELASGARRKIFIPKMKEDGEGTVVGALDNQGKKETSYMSPSQARRAALLQAPPGQNTPPMERRSPLVSRRKATLEVPKVMEETPKEEPASTKREEKSAEKKLDPHKAPQVIRKIRGEPFADASGHLKLWCQFFNVLSDSTIKWYRDEEEILEMKRSGGDESQVALAIVLATSQDCGVYGCTIKNEYGTDSTDYLLSADILSEILLKDDLRVGEEIEMTPLLFAKGLADSGSWGDKYFGRIMTETVHIGEGSAHKASRVRVIYGLDPIYESGSNCIIKVQNPIAYGTKQESNLAERNLQITKQECKVQNMIREYCKIFTAEARVSENFGCALEVIPQYLMYRPANSVPYATVEADLEGVFTKYCMIDPKGKLFTQTASEVEQKCSTFQHWIHQWTHGNLLVTRLEGVETKMTNVKVVTKSKGYQGLTEYGHPEILEQFLTHHQCNYYCGLLGLRPLKTIESLQQPTKMKGSRSPLVNRKLGSSSPQMSKKANCSPKAPRKIQESEDSKSDTKTKLTETADALETR